MTFNLNEEACVIYDGFNKMALGIVSEIDSESIVIEDSNWNGPTTATRIQLWDIDDRVS